MTVRLRRFIELEPYDAHAIWQLRQDVFVVEQGCPYSDLDGRDTEPGTLHAVLHHDGEVVGTLRILDDGNCWRIGRVTLARGARGRGLADDLIDAVLPELTDRPIVLDAQVGLTGWYASHGFTADGPEFLEDDILHLPMRRPRSSPDGASKFV